MPTKLLAIADVCSPMGFALGGLQLNVGGGGGRGMGASGYEAMANDVILDESETHSIYTASSISAEYTVYKDTDGVPKFGFSYDRTWDSDVTSAQTVTGANRHGEVTSTFTYYLHPINTSLGFIGSSEGWFLRKGNWTLSYDLYFNTNLRCFDIGQGGVDVSVWVSDYRDHNLDGANDVPGHWQEVDSFNVASGGTNSYSTELHLLGHPFWQVYFVFEYNYSGDGDSWTDLSVGDTAFSMSVGGSPA